MGQFMNPEDGNLHRPPKRWQNDNMKKCKRLGGYPPDRFEHTAFQRPVCLIHSDGTWKEMNAKGKEHERNMKGNECKMKGTWKERMICVDFRPRMLSHPQKAGKFTCFVQRAHHLRKRWACLKIDNMISGQFKWHRFLIQSHMHIQSYS